MDIKSLTLFRHLSQTLHYGETAQAMYVSPSTLSRVIQRLEDECGNALFTRDNRTVTLTQAGQQLVEFADEMLPKWEAVCQKIQQDSQELQGELSLYCSITASQSHLPTLIQALSLRFPKVTLKLHTGDPALSIKRVLSQEEDIALAIRTPQVSPQLHFVPVDKVPLVLIAPKSWRLSQIDQIDWRNHPVVLPETGYARDVVLDWFRSRDITPHEYASVGGNEAIVAMVALGCGLGMVPQIVLDHSSTASQVTRFLPPETVSYDLGLCCLASRKEQPLIGALLSLVSELS